MIAIPSHKMGPFLDFMGLRSNDSFISYASYSSVEPPFFEHPADIQPLSCDISEDSLLKSLETQEPKVLLDLFAIDQHTHLLLRYEFDSLRLTIPVPDHLHMPSLTDRFKSACWLERECFDLFGIVFEGHRNLKRLLLYPEFTGYPLRKTYPWTKAQPLVPHHAR
ncbi:MAG: NADH-quinone oxidoreductase subunit C [Myxococcaceae bacterium]|nr:NADH-quinone oxidoreductase subunit C [Myxococcaceae bacterium]MBH2006242.1 NADH-quinone oxidoreductase subunit C [Myxococcaceae bacterium]